MARHVLSQEDRLKGCEKALKSRKCPKQLREAVRRQRDDLRKKLGITGKDSPSRRTRAKSTVPLEILGL
jgi:hypothetical protein